jgi:hypothetical protein
MTLDEWCSTTPESIRAGLAKLWHGEGDAYRGHPRSDLPVDCTDADVIRARTWLADRVELLAAHLADIWGAP